MEMTKIQNVKASGRRSVKASQFRARTFLRSHALTLFALTLPLYAAEDFQSLPAGQQPALWQQFDTAQRGVSNFVSTVTQTKTLRILQQPIASEAKLWFSRPNLFRWEVTRPARSQTISDGKWLW